MGVSGLLPQLKPIQNPVSLGRYEGETLAIDGYAWLHRSAHSCAMELAMNQPTDKYLQFFIKRITMLRHFKITPFFVFDGDGIQVKKDTEDKRSQKRKENRDKAHALYAAGDRRQAYDYFQKCVSITPEMAKCVIEYLQTNSIPYVVAPYEADAQMVYLEKLGVVHGIISEDSDLLVFGCRRLITKLNDNAECIEIDRHNFNRLNMGKFPLSKLNDEQLRSLVCLSGCDYTSGIPKVGLLTAMKYVVGNQTMEQTILSIKREGKLSIPESFMEEYEYANFAFQFQRVWCPIKERLVTLNEIPAHLLGNEKLFNCIGHAIHRESKEKVIIFDFEMVDHTLHKQISLGELSPRDFLKPLVNREHALRTQSQSMVMTIDKFCTTKSVTSTTKTTATKTIGALMARKSHSLSNGPGIMNKLELALHKRKLSQTIDDKSEKQEKRKLISSQFFSSKSSKTPAPLSTDIRESQASDPNTFSKPSIEIRLQDNSKNDKENQEPVIEYRLDGDDDETFVPSSDKVVGEESEVLSEMDDENIQCQQFTLQEQQEKEDKQILAELRSKFFHNSGLSHPSPVQTPANDSPSSRVITNRVPLKNVTNVKRQLSPPKRTKNDLPPKPTPRPARRTMSGAMSTSSFSRSSSSVPSSSGSSTISLSQFAYTKR